MTTETLADRVEALDGPCREVDWEIFCIRQPDRLPYYERSLEAARSTAEANGIWNVRADAIIQQERGLICPRYTASLDAAMTLADGLTEATIWTIWNDALTACSCAEKDIRKDLPRFWVAAALRAQEPGE